MPEELLRAHLESFQDLRQVGPNGADWVHHRSGVQHGFHVVFGVMTHGNEVGPLPAALRLMAALADGSFAYGGALSITVGNPEAGLVGRRYLEADLNRSFIEGPDSHERRRARELMPTLDACDLFIDFHQTIGASLEAFWTLPWSETAWRWIRIAGGGTLWTTRAPGVSFASGTRCGDEYVRDRGAPGLTLEMGQKGFTEASERMTFEVMTRVLAAADAMAGGATLAGLAEPRSEPRFLVTVHKEPFGDPGRALRAGLRNFEPVRAGERLSPPGMPEVVAATDGLLLFPKYPPRDTDGAAQSPVPTDIFHIVRDPPDHPQRLFSDKPYKG